MAEDSDYDMYGDSAMHLRHDGFGTRDHKASIFAKGLHEEGDYALQLSGAGQQQNSSMANQSMLLVDPQPDLAMGGDCLREVGDTARCMICGRVFTGRHRRGNCARHLRLKHALRTQTIVRKSRRRSLEHEQNLARELWDHRFGSRQFRVGRDEESPFKEGRHLGRGGVGIVHETSLGSIVLALKRTYARKLAVSELNEMKVLGKISQRRHHHIVELIGSYIHDHGRSYELGLLIWPVAQCDLAAYLQDVDVIRRKRLEGAMPDQDYVTACDMVRSLSKADSTLDVEDILAEAQQILCQSFGCIASAVASLHEQGIRHKDLKPSQVLLSRNGLWLTDFGCSNDMSDVGSSLTSNGDIITKKYHSPERVERLPCGRAEDIFALGCIYLEMWLRLEQSGHDLREALMSSVLSQGWYFHDNLESVKNYLDVQDNLYTRSRSTPSGLSSLVVVLKQMLSRDPGSRTTIDGTLRGLRMSSHRFRSDGFPPLFGTCCRVNS